MKIRKIANIFIVLLVFAGGVFYAGYVSFLVKAGTCSVMVSKTGGIHENVIESGKFAWRWERLFPTNVTLIPFDLAPCKTSVQVSGELPGGSTYSVLFDEKPDFSYSASIDVGIRITPEGIHHLYECGVIKDNDGLKSYLDGKCRTASAIIVRELIEKPSSFSTAIISPFSLASNDLERIVKAHEDEFENLEIISVDFERIRIPDIEIYCKAKDCYDSYMKALNGKLSELAEKQAESMAEKDSAMKQLEKFGEILEKHPHLESLFKSGDITQTMNAIKSLK